LVEDSATDIEEPMSRWQRKAVQAEAVLTVLRSAPGEALTPETIRQRALSDARLSLSKTGIKSMLDSLARHRDGVSRVGSGRYTWSEGLAGEVGDSNPVKGSAVSDPNDAVDSKAVDKSLVPQTVQRMIQSRWNGSTLQEIGDDHGLTRERVRQLLKKWGGPSSNEVRQRRKVIEGAAAAQRSEEVAAEIRSLLKDGPMTAIAASEATGIPVADVTRSWPADLAHMRLRAPGRTRTRWSTQEILEAIREAALYAHPLTSSEYTELVRIGQVIGPSLPLIEHRFRTWRAACAAADVVAGVSPRRSYESRWTDDELLQVLRAYLLDPEAPNSAGKYDEWKRAHVPDGPSMMTLRVRFGSWERAKTLALTSIGETHE